MGWWSHIYITGLLAGGSQVQRIASPGTSSCWPDTSWFGSTKCCIRGGTWFGSTSCCIRGAGWAESCCIGIAPPISSTKGSRTKGVEGVDLPAPHFKRPQGKNRKRCCKRCNKSGHNITTCGREAPPPKRPRGRPVGSGTRKRKGSYESDDTQDDLASEMEDDETE